MIDDTLSHSTSGERAVLVAVRFSHYQKGEVEEHLTELAELAQTARAHVCRQVFQERQQPDRAYFIGRGKVDEIADILENDEANLVIFDDELSPAQARNLQKRLNVKVIDRTGLILDIFAQHAQTIEAKTQIELAQLNYLLPRLTRQWMHLSRQVGGIGTKGPGETQLETDRRLVRTRISRLKQKLREIERQQQTRRKNRDAFLRVALIGYTNAGKSTLMNALTRAGVTAEDKLFATLDTRVKRLMLDPVTPVLLSDTVGFIRKLPHQVVASFRTTLAEAREADILLHVIDASMPMVEDRIRVVLDLLKELKFKDQIVIPVFNKVDIVDDTQLMQRLHAEHPDAVFISAARHIGIDAIKKVLLNSIAEQFIIDEIKADYSHGSPDHLLRSWATILESRPEERYQYFKVKFHKNNRYRFEQLKKRFL
ncbi:MAG: GTPase HflX [Calditrichaeota bacterium]|nr:MAG: GTPase HflX [Calditrichota bacterium]